MLVPANLERLPVLQHGDLLIDPQYCTATLAGKKLELFPKEFETLYLLAQYPNWVLSSQQIYEYAWKAEPVDYEHVVRNTICQLRRKLERPGLIQTVVGYGYKLALEQEQDNQNMEK